MRLGLQREGTEENINFWFGSAIHFAMEDYFGWNRFGDPRRAFKAYYDAFDPLDRPDGAAEHYDLGLGMLDYFMDWYPGHNQELEFQTAWFTKTTDEETGEVTYESVEPRTEGSFPGTEFEVCLDMGLRVIVSSMTGRIIGIVDPETKEVTATFEDLAQMHIKHRNLEDIVDCEVDLDDFDRQYEVVDVSKMTTVTVQIQPISFHGTCDRILIDKWGRFWILDYKTAKSADVDKLDTDDQISRYCWALEQVIGIPISGFIYLQLTKAVPKAPRVLNSGELSTDKRQKTTRGLYRKAIINLYGSVDRAPQGVIDTLNVLAEKETPEGDDFIRWDKVPRTYNQKVSTYHHILAEAKEMIQMDQYLIPSPTRDCIWDCPFRAACIALDRQNRSEFDDALLGYVPRDKERSDEEPSFYARIKWPDLDVPVGGVPNAEELNMPRQELNVILPEKKEEE